MSIKEVIELIAIKSGGMAFGILLILSMGEFDWRSLGPLFLILLVLDLSFRKFRKKIRRPFLLLPRWYFWFLVAYVLFNCNQIIFALLSTIGLAGMGSNLIVMTLNDGKMPVFTNDPEKIKELQNSDSHFLANKETHFGFLGDRFGKVAASLGDILIALSGFLFIAYLLREMLI